MSDIVVNVTDPGSYAVSVDGATPTTATVSNGGSVAVTVPDVTIGDVTGLTAELAGKADAVHDHVMADITDLSFPVTSVNGLTGAVVIEAGGGGGGVSLADTTPLPLGTAAAGTAATASRADHVHEALAVSDVLGLSAELAAKLDDQSTVDGGDYVGVIIEPAPATPTITITGQPQDVTMSTAAGSSWTSFGSGSTYWRDAAYAGGTYVAVGAQFNAGSNRYYTLSSADGATWTFKGNGDSPTVPLASVATDGSTFLAVSSSGFSTTSSDGMSWAAAVAMPAACNAVAYGNSRYVAVGADATHSVDGGATWSTPVSLPASCKEVVYGSAGFLALPTAVTQSVYLSTDGVTWTTQTLPASRNWGSIAYGNGTYVAVSGVVAAYSTDGVTWTQTSTTSSSMTYAGYAGGTFILTGTSTIAHVSPDGVSWTPITLPSGGTFAAIAGSDSTIVLFNRSTTGLPHLFSVGTDSTSFSVAATLSPSGSLSYAWESSVDSGSTWSAVSGATTATLSLTGLTSADDGTQYRVVLSATGASTVTSNAATLTVT